MTDYCLTALHALLILAGLPLAFTTIGGLLVAFIQTLFSVQEASLTFVIKAGILCAVLVVGGNSGLRVLTSLLQQGLSLLPHAPALIGVG